MRASGVDHRIPALAGALAAVIAAGAVVGMLATRASLRADDERAFHAAAAAATARLRGDVAAITGAAAAAARAANPAAATAVVQRLPGVADARWVTAASDRLVAAARDAGRARTARRGQRYALVSPAVTTDGQSLAERRARFRGAVVVDVDVRALLARAAPGGGSAALAIAVRDGDGTVAAVGRASGSRPEAVSILPIADGAWELHARPARPFGAGALLPTGVLAGGLALAAAALATALAVRRDRAAVRAEAEARAKELEAIADAGVLLQQSLDLSDVVPAFTIRLADAFDLDRVGVLTAATGGDREVFSLGPATTDVAALPVDPDRAAAGEEFAIRLRRGNRDAGLLRIRSRRAIERDRMGALRAVAELLAAALGNIALYRDEQETVRRLQDVDRLKGDFVSTVSHELRTTVTAIAGFADLLDRQWERLPDPQRRDFVARVQRNASTLRMLVDEMLDFARLDRLAIRLAPDTVELGPAVAGIVDQLGALLDDHEVIADLADGVRVWADTRGLERIVANLLSNAAKYAPARTRIWVRVEPLDRGGRLVVADEGPGVPVEERERIFARFYRGDSAAARSTRGTGVGLAVVRELAEQLGARVWVDERPGGGARFTVEFMAPPGGRGEEQPARENRASTP